MIRMMSLMLMALSTLGAFAAAPKTGDVAPDFTLQGSDGKSYKLSQFKRQIVVLEWFNKDCPYVHKFYDSKTMQKLQREASHQGVIWLTMASSAEGKEGFLNAATAAKVRSEKEMANTALLLDAKGEAARLYAAKTTPHMFIIDKNGKIAYQGAIDDRPSAAKGSLEGASNYVSLALASLQKGEPIKTPASTPYGCSVKY